MYSALLSRKTLSQSLVTLSLFWKAQSVAWARRHTVYLERCVCCGNTVRETPIPWETLTLHVPWETASMYLERHLYHERPWHVPWGRQHVPWETVRSVSLHVPWETVSSALYLERQSALGLSVCMYLERQSALPCTLRDSQLCQCACVPRETVSSVSVHVPWETVSLVWQSVAHVSSS